MLVEQGEVILEPGRADAIAYVLIERALTQIDIELFAKITAKSRNAIGIEWVFTPWAIVVSVRSSGLSAVSRD